MDERFPNFLRQRHSEFTCDQALLPEGCLYPELTHAVFGACHRVHFELGPGFLPQIYRRSTMIELRNTSVPFEYIKYMPVEYEGTQIGLEDARLILVDHKILLAVEATKNLTGRVERVRTRMRTMKIKLGLLANFCGTKLDITPIRI
jgi:GxxExxY protein